MADSLDGSSLPTKENKQNIWTQILSEVASQATRKLPQNKRILVLGDDGSGKTSLITKLRDPGEEQMKKGSGLEFAFIDVHDEERDGLSVDAFAAQSCREVALLKIKFSNLYVQLKREKERAKIAAIVNERLRRKNASLKEKLRYLTDQNLIQDQQFKLFQMKRKIKQQQEISDMMFNQYVQKQVKNLQAKGRQIQEQNVNDEQDEIHSQIKVTGKDSGLSISESRDIIDSWREMTRQKDNSANNLADSYVCTMLQIGEPIMTNKVKQLLEKQGAASKELTAKEELAAANSIEAATESLKDSEEGGVKKNADETFKDEELARRECFARRISKIVSEKGWLVHTKRNLLMKKNRLGLRYEMLKERFEDQGKILEEAQDHLRDLEEEKYERRLRKKKGWRKLKFWK